MAPRRSASAARSQNLLVAHDVALGAFQVGPEGAEGAAIDADIGRVEMRVDVVIGEVAVLALAHQVGQLAECEQIGVLVEEDAVVEGQAVAGFDFFADDGQTSVSVARKHETNPVRAPRFDPDAFYGEEHRREDGRRSVRSSSSTGATVERDAG